MAPLKQLSSNTKIVSRSQNSKGTKQVNNMKNEAASRTATRQVVNKESHYNIRQKIKEDNTNVYTSNTDNILDNSSDINKMESTITDTENNKSQSSSSDENNDSDSSDSDSSDSDSDNDNGNKKLADEEAVSTDKNITNSSEKVNISITPELQQGGTTQPTEESKINLTNNLLHDKELESSKLQAVDIQEPIIVYEPIVKPIVYCSIVGNQSNNIKFSLRTKKYAFLSNFYNCEMTIDGKLYNHVEGYYQCHKFIDINTTAFEHIRNVTSPMACKRIAYSYYMSPERLELWTSSLRDRVMRRAVYSKFITNSDLSKQLIDTGDSILIESNLSDEYWASGKDGKGKNKLGELLMEVRTLLINSSFN